MSSPSHTSAGAFHGGAFFDAIGTEFDTLQRRQDVINADVLDAWFDPSPRVIEAIRGHLPWLLRTSPPTGCEGMIRTIARVRGVDADCILPGGGSSDLIFLALRGWLTASSRVLILDPMYGEYAHVLEKLIGCRVERFELDRAAAYSIDNARLSRQLDDKYDLVVIVNPNSPTGRHTRRDQLTTLLQAAPSNTRFWIDETYVDYAGPSESLEKFAAQSCNIFVCKSMSKAYALSGARAAYLCGPAQLLRELRGNSPPWAVSLPGQVAAVEALKDPNYYAARYAETATLREELAAQLATQLGWEVIPSVTNFLLCHLPATGPSAREVVAACAQRNLFLRDATNMGQNLGEHAVRIAVKDAQTNRRMLDIVRGLDCWKA